MMARVKSWWGALTAASKPRYARGWVAGSGPAPVKLNPGGVIGRPGGLPPGIRGLEWTRLRYVGRDLSIRQAADVRYTVRINEDGTFVVEVSP